MVNTTMAIKGEIDDTRSIRDACASKKRKESLSSFGSGKKQRTFVLQGSSRQDRAHQGQGQGGASSYTRPMTCYHCHQPRHKRQDCPRRKRFQSVRTSHPQSTTGRARMQYVPPCPSMGQ